MDFNFDYEWDGGGFSDFDDGYGGNCDDYYHEDYQSGDFPVDFDIGDVDYFHDDHVVDIHGGDYVAAELGIDGDSDLAAEIGIYGGGYDDSHGEGDLSAEIGIYGGDDDDLHGDGDLEAEIGITGGDYDIDGDGDLAAEIGITGGDYDIDGDGDLAAGIGLTGGEHDIDGDGDLAAGIGLTGGEHDIDSEGDLAADIGLTGGEHDIDSDGDLAADIGLTGGDYDIDDDGDLEAEIALGGDDDDDIDGVSDRYLTEEFGIDGGDDDIDVDDGLSDFDDFYGGEDSEAVVDDEDDHRGGRMVPLMELYDDDGETAFRLQLDGNEDLPVTRDGNTSTREITVQVSQSIIVSNSNPNLRRDEEGNDGDLAKKLKNGEMASSSGDIKKDLNANGSEDDGVSCPICLEPWTTDGDHIICCLPCGHVYGLSCIKNWLQQSNSGKCPQCNKVASVADIRKIYGLTIVTGEKDLKEKIQLLEAKCASLELTNADLQRKEAEWRQSEAVLVQQLKPVANE